MIANDLRKTFNINLFSFNQSSYAIVNIVISLSFGCQPSSFSALSILTTKSLSANSYCSLYKISKPKADNFLTQIL